jgi:signal peptidase I
MSIKESANKFWSFLKEDTWQSWLVSLILIVVIIKFIFFPIMTFLTGSALPLVVVESCSMYHETNFDSWWSQNGEWYISKNISKEDFKNSPLYKGLNKGDILLVTRERDPKIGDIIIFNAQAKYPLIHRIVSLDPLQTKGDHNTAQLVPGNNPYHVDETNIQENTIVGKASIKIIPLLGWIKLIWFEPSKISQAKAQGLQYSSFCR